MKVRIICIGKLKERYLTDACAEYMKRLTRFCEPEITELSDEKTPSEPSPAEVERVKQAECERLTAKLGPQDYVIALDPRGKMLSSEELAEEISCVMVKGKSRIAFLIGGSYGLTEETRRRADAIISFSRLTFSHQIFRVMLLEQVYRAFKIISGEPYHK